MKIIRWSFILTALLFGLAATGLGIYFAARGQGCMNDNDYACVFGFMTSFVIIPYGLAVLISTGLLLPSARVLKVFGSILTINLGWPTLALSCVVLLWALTAEGENLLQQNGVIFLFILFLIFAGSVSMLGAGIMELLQREKKPVEAGQTQL